MPAASAIAEQLEPVRLQRAEGHSSITMRHHLGATRLKNLYQEGCAKLRLPKPLPGCSPEAIFINTSGGLTGGDRLTGEVALEQGAQLTMTTQACERIYRSSGGPAIVSNRLSVASGARLNWLPQETILYNGGQLARSLEVDLEGDAELLAVEVILFGRVAMGEQVEVGLLHDRWRVRRDGQLLFADDLRFDGPIMQRLASPAGLNGGSALATVLFAAHEPERLLEPVRELLGGAGGARASGASAWGGKLLVRIVEENGLALRRRLEPVLTLLAQDVPLPKVWHL